jgi:hypothetical protein
VCINISSIKQIFSNQSHYFPDRPCKFKEETNVLQLGIALCGAETGAVGA